MSSFFKSLKLAFGFIQLLLSRHFFLTPSGLKIRWKGQQTSERHAFWIFYDLSLMSITVVPSAPFMWFFVWGGWVWIRWSFACQAWILERISMNSSSQRVVAGQYVSHVSTWCSDMLPSGCSMHQLDILLCLLCFPSGVCRATRLLKAQSLLFEHLTHPMSMRNVSQSQKTCFGLLELFACWFAQETFLAFRSCYSSFISASLIIVWILILSRKIYNLIIRNIIVEDYLHFNC